MQRLITYGSLAWLAAAGLSPAWAQQAPPGPNKEEGRPPEAARPGPSPQEHAPQHAPQQHAPQQRAPQEHAPPAHAAPPRAAAPRAVPHHTQPRPAPRPAPQRSPGPEHNAAPPPPPPNQGHPQRYHIGGYQQPHGYYHQSWSTGVVLPSLFRTQTYWILPYATYGLAPPEPGAHWVRVDDDALLVEDDTGRILAVEQGIFY